MLVKTCDVCGKTFKGFSYVPTPFSGKQCCLLCNNSGKVVRSLLGSGLNERLIIVFTNNGVAEVERCNNQTVTVKDLSLLAGQPLLLSSVDDYTDYWSFSSANKEEKINFYYYDIFRRKLNGIVIMIHKDLMRKDKYHEQKRNDENRKRCKCKRDKNNP